MKTLQDALFVALECASILDVRLRSVQYKLPFGEDDNEAYIAVMMPNELTLTNLAVQDVTKLHNLPKGEKRFILSFYIRNYSRVFNIRMKDRNDCLINMIKLTSKNNKTFN